MRNWTWNAVVWTGTGLSLLATAYAGGRSAGTSASPAASAGAVLTVSPNPATAIIGTQLQFTATVAGVANPVVTWSLTAASPSGTSLSPGTISTSGLYTTPYPAPAAVTVTATFVSAQNTTVSGSATLTLSPPATADGPALIVDVSRPGNRISPDIYGMNAFGMNPTSPDPSVAKAFVSANITVDRWGGNTTERYNYKLDVTSHVIHRYFEDEPGTVGDAWTPVSGVTAFDEVVKFDNRAGIKTMGAVPVLGWVAKDGTSCSFPVATYPGQQQVNRTRGCGNGIYPVGVHGCANPSGCKITGNDPALSSVPVPPPTPPAVSAVTKSWAESTWAGGWVTYLVSKFGPGNPPGGGGKGVAIYALDNEPFAWDNVDRDIHPNPFTYDEVTNDGIGTALAVKTADPTAEVSGPVIGLWWSFFYSEKDVASGLATGPCHQPWSNPIDRAAHGGVPFVEYYLRQFAAAETKYGKRLLDYLDAHTYYATIYPPGTGVSVHLDYDRNHDPSNTGAQMARLNSTRALWDPTYTDSNHKTDILHTRWNSYPEPNYSTAPSSLPCTELPQAAPKLIRRMKDWVAADYPGTKLAITEYSWGGMDQVNGALAQADILGIFGREGLDLATLWTNTKPSAQTPGMKAFAIYRNYDGKRSAFGATVLPSSSGTGNASQGIMSIYGALRSSDGAVTVVVINKTYGNLTDTLTLTGLSPNITTAQAYLYSNANLAEIVAQPAVTVMPGSAASTISYTFPAQSITLFVIPQA